MSDFSNERHPVARIEHVCDECSNLIRVGEQYQYIFATGCGGRYYFKTCSTCEAIRHELNLSIDDPEDWIAIGQLEQRISHLREHDELVARFQAHKAKATK